MKTKKSNLAFPSLFIAGIVMLIFILIAYSCEDEIPDRLEPAGYVSFNADFIGFKNSSLTSKIPECSDPGVTPYTIEYVFQQRNTGFVFERQTQLEVAGEGTVISKEAVSLPIGLYTVQAIDLVSIDGAITHSVPKAGEDEFNFAAFTSNPIPFLVEVQEEVITDIQSSVMCYTPVDGEGSVSGVQIKRLGTAFFTLPDNNCISYVEVIYNGHLLIDFSDFTGSEQKFNFPMDLNFQTFTLRSYAGERLIEELIIVPSKYQLTDIPDPENTVDFQIGC